MKSEIKTKTLVIVEGKTDSDFLKLYFKYLEIKDRQTFEVANGNFNLKSISPSIVKAIKKGEKIKIIFDADDDWDKSKRRIDEQIQKIAQEEKVQIDYDLFLFPNNRDKGNLETLIECIAQEKRILGCFDSYRVCIQSLQADNQGIRLPTPKSKVFAYLSSFGFKNGDNNFHLNERLFDLDSASLDPLKTFLLS